MVRVVDKTITLPHSLKVSWEIHFAENNTPGERVVTVVASDADSGKNAEIAYSLDPSVNGTFYIDTDNGDIRATGVLDREQRDRYEFRVIARDKGTPSLQGSTTVVVQITDRNDNAPKFVQDIFMFYVKENLLSNSPVGMLTVTDADGGENAELSLFVEEDDDEEENETGSRKQETVTKTFSIENNTGTIFSALSFDHENDNAPSIISPSNDSYTLLTPSSGARTVVRTVTALDSDAGSNADLRYALIGGNPFHLFEIGLSSGVITLTEPLERRHRGLHRLVVRVNDSGVPSLCTTALVHIFVNESLTNATLVDAQRKWFCRLVQTGYAAVVLIILLVLTARQCGALGKNGYEAGKKEPEEDFFTPRPPSQPPPEKKKRRDAEKRDVRSKSERSLYAGIFTVNSCRHTEEEEEEEEEVEEEREVSQRIGTRRHRSSPDLARHYKSSSPLPAVHLQPNSPPVGGKKHQAVQELPPTNTFTGKRERER
ncbi:hypothetical protein QTP86_012578 [Hemibagrus guttatus]|nr:hypothetical protein QTP86_012578 [Hemibagrus guttatus]